MAARVVEKGQPVGEANSRESAVWRWDRRWSECLASGLLDYESRKLAADEVWIASPAAPFADHSCWAELFVVGRASAEKVHIRKALPGYSTGSSGRTRDENPKYTIIIFNWV